MGSDLQNLGVAAGINLGLAVIFIAAYSVAIKMPINTRVYFPALFQVSAIGSPAATTKLSAPQKTAEWPQVAIEPAIHTLQG